MPFESLTDVKIENLLKCNKQLSNPKAKFKEIEGRKQINYKAVALDGSNHQFEIYYRQNLREGMEDDFSCGISWISSNGEQITLKRYNGPSHNHPNHLEQTKTGYNCHIHLATERYIKANRKPEGFAEITDRYTSVEGALHCLIKDCNISGIKTNPDDQSQVKLF